VKRVQEARKGTLDKPEKAGGTRHGALHGALPAAQTAGLTPPNSPAGPRNPSGSTGTRRVGTRRDATVSVNGERSVERPAVTTTKSAGRDCHRDRGCHGDHHPGRDPRRRDRLGGG
jgi:hypothetical protein